MCGEICLRLARFLGAEPGSFPVFFPRRRPASNSGLLMFLIRHSIGQPTRMEIRCHISTRTRLPDLMANHNGKFFKRTHEIARTSKSSSQTPDWRMLGMPICVSPSLMAIMIRIMFNLTSAWPGRISIPAGLSLLMTTGKTCLKRQKPLMAWCQSIIWKYLIFQLMPSGTWHTSFENRASANMNFPSATFQPAPPCPTRGAAA